MRVATVSVLAMTSEDEPDAEDDDVIVGIFCGSIFPNSKKMWYTKYNTNKNNYQVEQTLK